MTFEHIVNIGYSKDNSTLFFRRSDGTTLARLSESGTGSGGTTILSGSGPPPEFDGAPGDFYLDTDAQILYGPKAEEIEMGDSEFCRSTMDTINEQYPGNVVTGQLYKFTSPGFIQGIEFRTPQLSVTKGFQISVWTYGGDYLFAQKSDGESSNEIDWQEVYFDEPLYVVADMDYMISVGYPNTGNDCRGYSHVDHATVLNGSIVCSSTGRTWANQAAGTGYPSSEYQVGLDIAQIGPIFAPALGEYWPVALKGAP
jgi:hypothetical protein